MRWAYLGLLALACGGEGADDDDDTALKQLWRDTAPQQYVAKSCSTGFTARACTVSAVDQGQVVAAQQQLGSDGAWTDAVPPSDVVEGMLNAASGKPDRGCERRVTQHETYPIPKLVYSDCGMEGWGIELTCFVADTLELSRCQ